MSRTDSWWRRKAGHHVGFQLGQVDDHIAVQHRLQQGELLYHLALCRHLPAFAVGVKSSTLLPAHVGQAAYFIDAPQDARVVDSAGRIRHRDGSSTPAANRPDHRPHHRRVGGHRPFRRVLGQQVGLKQHPLASKRLGCGQLAEQPLHRRVHRLLVIICRCGKIHVFIHSRPLPAAAAKRIRSDPAPASGGSRNRHN